MRIYELNTFKNDLSTISVGLLNMIQIAGTPTDKKRYIKERGDKAIFELCDLDLNLVIQEIVSNLTSDISQDVKLNYLKYYVFDLLNYIDNQRQVFDAEISKLHYREETIIYYYTSARVIHTGWFLGFKFELFKVIKTLNLKINKSLEFGEEVLNPVEIEDLSMSLEIKLRANVKTKFVYLKELGLLNTQEFKGLSSKMKKIALSEILGCHMDYARDLYTTNFGNYNNGKEKIPPETINDVKDKLKLK